ncbi:hypothetical protein F5Y13DRAFT_156747 [Hypoxylon sp. FL1857]|nr:hypothetical protein F5Y13DRAFT_156747 [Hypoxylon sp. FL1857]
MRMHANNNHCSRCGVIFNNDQDHARKTKHIRTGTCEIRDFEYHGATNEQIKEMKGASRTGDCYQRWFTISKILFPSDGNLLKSPWAPKGLNVNAYLAQQYQQSERFRQLLSFVVPDDSALSAQRKEVVSDLLLGLAQYMTERHTNSNDDATPENFLPLDAVPPHSPAMSTVLTSPQPQGPPTTLSNFSRSEIQGHASTFPLGPSPAPTFRPDATINPIVLSQNFDNLASANDWDPNPPWEFNELDVAPSMAHGSITGATWD